MMVKMYIVTRKAQRRPSAMMDVRETHCSLRSMASLRKYESATDSESKVFVIRQLQSGVH